MLTLNSIAPDFILADQHGKPVSLSDYRGRKLVLVFYPKDNSPVCTRQLNEYSTHYSEIVSRGARILGISADNEHSHNAFVQQCSLAFPLLADTGKVVCKAYDALTMVGTVKRVVYIISETGVIEHRIQRFSLFYPHANELIGLL